MLFSFNFIWVLVPLVVFQYVLAIFCLLKLLFLNLEKRKFWAWNFFILLAFYVGGITFLLCRYVFNIFPPPPSLDEPQKNKKDENDNENSETGQNDKI